MPYWPSLRNSDYGEWNSRKAVQNRMFMFFYIFYSFSEQVSTLLKNASIGASTQYLTIISIANSLKTHFRFWLKSINRYKNYGYL